MRAAVYQGAFDIRPQEVPLPVLQEGEVLIKVGYAGICGSDLTIYLGIHRRAKAPLIMGHEFSGTVVEVKGESGGFSVGDRVVVEPMLACGECPSCKEGFYYLCDRFGLIGVDVDGAFAEYVRAPVGRVYHLPDAVSLESGALIEPVAVAVHAVRRSRLELGARAVVLGAGPIGLLVAQVARVVASVPVEMMEVSDFRLERARELGFDPVDGKNADVKAEILRRTDGRGADVLFDAAGVASTVQQHPLLVRKRGQVVMVAMPKEPMAVDFVSSNLKELETVGCMVYNAQDYRAAISLVAQGKIDVKPLISHVLPLERAKEGLELAKQAKTAVKVLVSPLVEG